MERVTVAIEALKTQTLTPAVVAEALQVIADEARDCRSGAHAVQFERVLREGAVSLAAVEA